MTSRTIRVVAAVIQQDGKYLITQRREEASLPLLWEFPGGRVEPGESDIQALTREVQERLGVEILLGKPVAFRRHQYQGYCVEMVLYEANISSDAELEPKRVKEYRWVDADEFAKYSFPPADRSALDDIQLLFETSHMKKPPQA